MCPASKALKMTSGAPRALAGALKREQWQNHAENIICYCPEVAEPPAGRRGCARGCRGRSGTALGCAQRSEKEEGDLCRAERAPQRLFFCVSRAEGIRPK